MALWNLPNAFATLSGNQPASKLDQNFDALAITPQYATAVSGTDAIALTVPLSFTAYAIGMQFWCVASGTNTSSTVTLNVNGVGPVSVVKDSNSALSLGDILAGAVVGFYYDGANFHLLAPRVDSQSTVNRVINGDISIDQRNNGSAVTVNSAGPVFGPDLWRGLGQTSDGVFTLQRSSASPPPGFTNFLRAAVTTADASIGASQSYRFITPFEGSDMFDLAFGSADAKTVTLSFWVRSSLTGTFSGALINASGARCYPFTFSISAANTWQQKSVLISGDITGTWPTSATQWGSLSFDLGSGASLRGTPGAWAGTSILGATGAVSLISTLSATLDVTGVQLEEGEAPTPFAIMPFQQRLALCQRYLPVVQGIGGSAIGVGQAYATTLCDVFVPYDVPTRVAPTGVTVVGTANFTVTNNLGGGIAATVIAFQVGGRSGSTIRITTAGSLAAGNATTLSESNVACQLIFTGAEL